MIFEGVQTGLSFDFRAAMRTIYGIRPSNEYSSFSGIRDMASAEKSANSEKPKEQEEDSGKYHSFGKLREVEFLPF